jgi:beta-lactamase superfamily II metal-dependent hydrolase
MKTCKIIKHNINNLIIKKFKIKKKVCLMNVDLTQKDEEQIMEYTSTLETDILITEGHDRGLIPDTGRGFFL